MEAIIAQIVAEHPGAAISLVRYPIGSWGCAITLDGSAPLIDDVEHLDPIQALFVAYEQSADDVTNAVRVAKQATGED